MDASVTLRETSGRARSSVLQALELRDANWGILALTGLCDSDLWLQCSGQGGKATSCSSPEEAPLCEQLHKRRPELQEVRDARPPNTWSDPFLLVMWDNRGLRRRRTCLRLSVQS